MFCQETVLQNWSEMTTLQRVALFTNYLASLAIILVAFYPEATHRRVSGLAKRNVNPMYLIVLFAIIVFVMNSSFIVQ